MFDYARDTFIVIEMFIKFFISYFALIYFNIHAGYIVLFMVIITLSTILRFDKVLVAQYHKLFKAENKIAEKIYDALSNITTVIVLRIEKLIFFIGFRGVVVIKLRHFQICFFPHIIILLV